MSPKLLGAALVIFGAGCTVDVGILEEALLTATHKASVRKGLLTITGTREGSSLALRLSTPSLLAVDVDDDGTAEFVFDRSTFDRIRIDAGDGDDLVRMDETNGAFTVEEQVTIVGGAGNDTLRGGIGAEILQGGPGDDLIDGGPGADTISMGDGNDSFVWDPGDGSDVVDGEAGSDIIIFNGAIIGEQIALSANGSRLRLTRDIAAVNLDAGGVERVDFIARGGSDRVLVNNLAGTPVTRVNVDLAGSDAQADVVIVEGTTALSVAAEGAAVVVSGQAATVAVAVTGGEPDLDALEVHAARVDVNGSAAPDTMEVSESSGHGLVTVAGFNVKVDAFGMSKLSVNGLGGDDLLRVHSAANALPVQLDGGDGNDQLFGGSFSELLLGGPGDDVVHGGPGADTIMMGDDNDTFVWDPGDGSDVVEGEAGNDAVVFNGANIGENIDASAAGSRLRLTRDIAAITLDAGGVERVDFIARGGADHVMVHDLSATQVARVNVDLSGSDGVADVVTVEGSDSVSVAAEGAAVIATGAGALVSVTGGEPALDAIEPRATVVSVNGSAAADTMEVSEASSHALVSVAGFNVKVDAFGMSQLSLNGLGGDDLLRVFSGLNPLPIQLDGGDGNDQLFGGNHPELLLGGPGDDVLHGGPGADTLRMGDGNDTFVWDPGDGSDVVEGEAGNDAIVFNGSNIGEQMVLGANGSRLRLTRDIGAVTLDAAGIERVDVAARGGSDRLTVGDLAGTQVAQVNLDLAAIAGTGTGDAVSDQVVVLGSPNPDVIAVSADGGAVIVSGLAATTRVIAPESFDQLIVNGLGGLDAFSVGPGAGALMTLTINQD